MIVNRNDLSELALLEPVGLRAGWRERMLERVNDAVDADVPGVTVSSGDVRVAGSCVEWWHLTRSARPVTPPLGEIRGDLIRAILTRWLEQKALWEVVDNTVFVRAFLADEANLDPSMAAWLHLEDDAFTRTVVNEATRAIRHLTSTWPGLAEDPTLHLGPVISDTLIGGVHVEASGVDVTLGEATFTDTTVWPGATLVRFMPFRLIPEMFDDMGLCAVVHGLATGAPPERLVLWSWSTGESATFVVHPAWWEEHLARFLDAAIELGRLEHHGVARLSGGPQCVMCPSWRTCPASEADQYPPF